jgi:hypothetical protein
MNIFGAVSLSQFQATLPTDWSQSQANQSVPFSAEPGIANLFVPQVLPGYCKGKSPSGAADCFMGEGLITGSFAQSSYIGPFCHPQLQSSSHDAKGYSATVWGGGQNFPQQVKHC